MCTGRNSLLVLLRQGAMLAVLVSVWPFLLLGLIVKWCTLTPSAARASFSAPEERQEH